MKALITQYGAGSRSPECVRAYRDYHREYQRGWVARRREYQAAAMQDAVAAALTETIERTRLQIAAELCAERFQ